MNGVDFRLVVMPASISPSARIEGQQFLSFTQRPVLELIGRKLHGPAMEGKQVLAESLHILYSVCSWRSES